MKWFKSAAAAPAEPPQDAAQHQHTHHHHPPGYVSLTLTAATLLALALWGLQSYAVYLLESLHVDDPAAVFALLVWGCIVGLPGLMFVNWILHGWAAAAHARRLERDTQKFRLLELQHKLMASAVADSGALSPDERRRAALVTVIMVDAYSAGEYGPRDRRPWARRNAGEYTLTGEHEPVGENSATVAAAAAWLRDNRVIIGPSGREQVNRADYPNLAAVQRKLHMPAVIKNA